MVKIRSVETLTLCIQKLEISGGQPDSYPVAIYQGWKTLHSDWVRVTWWMLFDDIMTQSSLACIEAHVWASRAKRRSVSKAFSFGKYAL